MSNSAGVGTNMNLTGEKPKWKLPFGNVPDLVAKYYFRSDTPTGRSVEMPPPNAVTMFRQLIQSGAIVPDNQSAQNMAMSEGGVQNGQGSMFGPDVPFIEGLPGGMDAATWNALTARAEQKFQERVKQAEITGEWEGKSTLERERIEAEIKRDIFKNETDRYTAEQNVRQKDTDLSRLEQERLDARRAGDLDREQALNIEIDRQKRLREEMSGWIGGEGGQATLGREDQAFNQSVKAAELAANPRTGLQSWMMGQRQGLNGQPAVNFVPPTTSAPGQAQINPVNAWQMPGGTTTTAGQTPTSGAGQPNGFIPPTAAQKPGVNVGAPPPPPAYGMGSQVQSPTNLAGTGSPAVTASLTGTPEPEKKEPSLSGAGGGGYEYGTGGGIEDQLAAQQPQPWQATQMPNAGAGLPDGMMRAAVMPDGWQKMPYIPEGGTGMPLDRDMMQPMPWQQPGMAGIEPWQGMTPEQQIERARQLGQLPGGMNGIEPWQGATPEQQDERRRQLGQLPGGMNGIEPWNMPGGGRFQVPNAKEQMMRQMMQQRAQAQAANNQAAAALGRDPNAASLDPAAQQQQQWQVNALANAGQTGMMQEQRTAPQPVSQPMVPNPAAPAAAPAAAPQSGFAAAQQQTAQKTGPTATPTGQNQMPTTAFTETLMQGKAVPNQGNGQTQGAWWNASNFQNTANPGKWRVQDFMRGTRDEQQGALGAASFAGFTDDTSMDLMKKQLPQFSAPRSGRLA